jgi:ribosomal protein S27AE
VGRHQFSEFKASELFCPKCGGCQPVRERASAVPGAMSVELLCSRCGTVVGQHTVVDNSLAGKLSRLAGGLFGSRK